MTKKDGKLCDLPFNKMAYLKEELTKRHPGKEFFIGWQCGLVDAGVRDSRLHDDTCAIITSDNFLKM